MPDLGIVMLHHNWSPVFVQNLDSCRRHNPDATVVTYHVDAMRVHDPDLAAFHAILVGKSADMLFRSFWRRKTVSCKRWFVCEWDTYFNASVDEFFAPVANEDMVVLDLKRQWTDPDWAWFVGADMFTPEAQEKRMGIVPFAFLAKEHVIDRIMEQPLVWGGHADKASTNGECRFGTQVAMAGIIPTVYCPAGARYGWVTVHPSLVQGRSIFHPVKSLIGS